MRELGQLFALGAEPARRRLHAFLRSKGSPLDQCHAFVRRGLDGSHAFRGRIDGIRQLVKLAPDHLAQPLDIARSMLVRLQQVVRRCRQRKRLLTQIAGLVHHHSRKQRQCNRDHRDGCYAEQPFWGQIASRI